MIELIHKPVLLKEVIEWLHPLPNQVFLDGTLGCGGHSAEILRNIQPNGFLWAIDCDKDAINIAREKLTQTSDRFKIINDNFSNLELIAVTNEISNLDGILFDFGVSSLQLDTPARGFSFKNNGVLDMRMNVNSDSPKAIDLINTLGQKEIEDIIFKYAESRHARKLAANIVSAREKKRIESTEELHEIIQKTIHFHKGMKSSPSGAIFQGFRIAVNDELNSITRMLPVAVSLLKSGGRMAIISFNSLEDRIVKTFFRQESRDCICPPKMPACNCTHKASIKLLFNKPVVPSEKEMEENNRSRSAKLRVIEKL